MIGWWTLIKNKIFWLKHLNPRSDKDTMASTVNWCHLKSNIFWRYVCNESNNLVRTPDALSGTIKRRCCICPMIYPSWHIKAVAVSKAVDVADRRGMILPWRRAECESWWFVRDCPLGDSRRILTEVEKATQSKIGTQSTSSVAQIERIMHKC